MNKVKTNKLQRDISLIDINRDEVLVIACDSAGGIGFKEADRVKVPPEMIGVFTARVAMMEVLAVNAEIISIIDTLSVEFSPTGEKILEGIKKEVEKIGMDRCQVINGSTEENIKTVQTALGVTVIGKVNTSKMRTALSQAGDLVVSVGMPLVGEEVIGAEDITVDLKDLQKLLKLKAVHEIIPAGSKGLVHEAQVLAAMSGLKLEMNTRDNGEVDIHKSAGPATALLVTLAPFKLEELKNVIDKPTHVIANLTTDNSSVSLVDNK